MAPKRLKVMAAKKQWRRRGGSKNIVTKNVKERLAGTLSQSKREEEEG